MKKLRSGSRRLVMAALLTLPTVSVTAMAQSTSGPYEPELQQLVLETKIDLANIRPAPADDFAALLKSGELRYRIDNWNFRGRNYRMSIFLVAPGSPLPTPAAQLPEATSSMMIVQAGVRTETIFHVNYADSGPGIAFGGRVLMKIGGIGNIEPGEVWMAGFAYPPEAMTLGPAVAATFKQVTVWSPNAVNAFSETATGTIQVAPPRN